MDLNFAFQEHALHAAEPEQVEGETGECNWCGRGVDLNAFDLIATKDFYYCSRGCSINDLSRADFQPVNNVLAFPRRTK